MVLSNTWASTCLAPGLSIVIVSCRVVKYQERHSEDPACSPKPGKHPAPKADSSARVPPAVPANCDFVTDEGVAREKKTSRYLVESNS